MRVRDHLAGSLTRVSTPVVSYPLSSISPVESVAGRLRIPASPAGERETTGGRFSSRGPRGIIYFSSIISPGIVTDRYAGTGKHWTAIGKTCLDPVGAGFEVPSKTAGKPNRFPMPCLPRIVSRPVPLRHSFDTPIDNYQDRLRRAYPPRDDAVVYDVDMACRHPRLPARARLSCGRA
jgi:hypothetical protein